MRFVSPRDYGTIVKINQELLNKIIDVTAVIFKLNQTQTQVNSYGEGTRKTWRPGVEVACLVDRSDTNVTEQMQTIDVNQDAKFSFLRAELSLRDIYPEAGDYIWWDNQYYEIHNTNEVQLWGGRPEYRHSIVCETHLTRNTSLQIEKPLL